ncbi:SGNH/GDSL hydrolase family protein [Cellulomonas soli]
MNGIDDTSRMPRSVVFAGDSITEWGRHEDPDGWGSGYVGLLARGPLAAATVTNTGVGGDRVRDLQARWADDVLPLQADVLSLYVGVNDTWRRFDQGEETPAEEFEAVLRQLLAPWVERGTQLVLVEPFVVPVEPSQEHWHTDLGPKQEAVRRVAADLDAAHVPLAAPLAALAADLGPHQVASDGVHPTPAGHRLLADAWWAAYRTRYAPALA